MKTFLIIIGVVILGVVGQNMFLADKTTAEKAPDFNLQDYNGKAVSLADFAGKPVVITPKPPFRVL